MNFIDVFIILVIVFFGYSGFHRRNLIGELADLLSFILSLVLSLSSYNQIGKVFQTSFGLPHSIASVLGFITVWFLVETSFILLFQIILSRIKFSSWMSKLNFLSVLPSIFKGIILIAIFLIVLVNFPTKQNIRKEINESKIASLIISRTQKLETPLKNVFGGIGEDTLTFLTVKPETNERVELGFKTSAYFANEDLENQMIQLVNKERTSKGLKPLIYDQKLRAAARGHSEDMFERGYFAHYSPEGKSVADRADKENVNFLVIGENLAFAPTLQLAHNGLMNSPGHRANILSEDYSKAGIGIMDGTSYGLMITQVFSN